MPTYYFYFTDPDSRTGDWCLEYVDNQEQACAGCKRCSAQIELGVCRFSGQLVSDLGITCKFTSPKQRGIRRCFSNSRRSAKV
jgi:hypothetical protein